MKRVNNVLSGARSAMDTITGSTRSIQGVGQGPSRREQPLHVDAQMQRRRSQRAAQGFTHLQPLISDRPLNDRALSGFR